jgi:hypothetical protein
VARHPGVHNCCVEGFFCNGFWKVLHGCLTKVRRSRSLLYNFPGVSTALVMMGAQRYASSLGMFGHPSEKMVELYSTCPTDLMFRYLVRTKRMWQSARKLKLSLDPNSVHTLAHKTKRGNAARGNGWFPGAWVRGRSDLLASSQTYPRQFCENVAELVRATLHTA